MVEGEAPATVMLGVDWTATDWTAVGSIAGRFSLGHLSVTAANSSRPATSGRHPLGCTSAPYRSALPCSESPAAAPS